MIELYYWTTPNGHKVSIFLEEAGLEYKIFPVNISKGEQFNPDFLASGLDAVEGDDVTLATMDPMKPAVLRGAGHDDYLYLLMPVRVP